MLVCTCSLRYQCGLCGHIRVQLCCARLAYTSDTPHTAQSTDTHTHTDRHSRGRMPPHSHTHTHTIGSTVRVAQRAHEGKLSRFMTRGQQREAELCIECKNKRRSSMSGFLKTAFKIEGLKCRGVNYVFSTDSLTYVFSNQVTFLILIEFNFF